MLTAKKIITLIEKNIQVLKKEGVIKIGIFGSFSTGKAVETSDVDIIVKFEDPNFDHYMNVKFFLQNLLKKKIDLVTEDALRPQMKYVLKEAQYAKTS